MAGASAERVAGAPTRSPRLISTRGLRRRAGALPGRSAATRIAVARVGALSRRALPAAQGGRGRGVDAPARLAALGGRSAACARCSPIRRVRRLRARPRASSRSASASRSRAPPRQALSRALLEAHRSETLGQDAWDFTFLLDALPQFREEDPRRGPPALGTIWSTGCSASSTRVPPRSTTRSRWLTKASLPWLLAALGQDRRPRSAGGSAPGGRAASTGALAGGGFRALSRRARRCSEGSRPDEARARLDELLARVTTGCPARRATARSSCGFRSRARSLGNSCATRSGPPPATRGTRTAWRGRRSGTGMAGEARAPARAGAEQRATPPRAGTWKLPERLWLAALGGAGIPANVRGGSSAWHSCGRCCSTTRRAPARAARQATSRAATSRRIPAGNGASPARWPSSRIPGSGGARRRPRARDGAGRIDAYRDNWWCTLRVAGDRPAARLPRCDARAEAAASERRLAAWARHRPRSPASSRMAEGHRDDAGAGSAPPHRFAPVASAAPATTARPNPAAPSGCCTRAIEQRVGAQDAFLVLSRRNNHSGRLACGGGVICCVAPPRHGSTMARRRLSSDHGAASCARSATPAPTQTRVSPFFGGSAHASCARIQPGPPSRSALRAGGSGPGGRGEAVGRRKRHVARCPAGRESAHRRPSTDLIEICGAKRRLGWNVSPPARPNLGVALLEKPEQRATPT